MIKLAVWAFGLTLSLNAFAALDSYQVAPGDRLVQILRDHEYGESYRELLPFVNQTVLINPTAFKNNDPDFLIPGTQIELPENPNKIEVVAEPEPVPEPETVPEPEPTPEPEPEPLYIGTINVTNGQANILRGEQSIEVTQQDRLLAGDIIVTRQVSIAEITLTDETRFSLGPNSRFSIDEYRYPQAEVSQAPKGSLIATIQQGVLRTISGLLSKLKSNDYQIKSSLTVTIGIRGTDFTVRSCSDQALCGDLFGVSAAVLEGGISFKNESSEVDLDQNQFTQIQTSTAIPEVLPVPEGFFDIKRALKDIKVDKPWWQAVVDWVTDLF